MWACLTGFESCSRSYLLFYVFGLCAFFFLLCGFLCSHSVYFVTFFMMLLMETLMTWTQLSMFLSLGLNLDWGKRSQTIIQHCYELSCREHTWCQGSTSFLCCTDQSFTMDIGPSFCGESEFCVTHLLPAEICVFSEGEITQNIWSSNCIIAVCCDSIIPLRCYWVYQDLPGSLKISQLRYTTR